MRSLLFLLALVLLLICPPCSSLRKIRPTTTLPTIPLNSTGNDIADDTAQDTTSRVFQLSF